MDFSDFMNKLRYRFNDSSLIEEALRHSSYVNEIGDGELRDNERLEFLGDAVLNLIVGHLLMERLPELNEGDLSRMRASLVNESQLADIARSINLGSHIKLGKGELLSNGQDKNSILANAFEQSLDVQAGLGDERLAADLDAPDMDAQGLPPWAARVTERGAG